MKRKISSILAVLFISVLANFLSASGISTYSGVYKDVNVLLSISAQSIYSIKRPNMKREKSSGHTISFRLTSKKAAVKKMQVIFNKKTYDFKKAENGQGGKYLLVELDKPELNYFFQINYVIGKQKISRELITHKGKLDHRGFGKFSVIQHIKSHYDREGYKYIYNTVKNYYTLYNPSNKKVANIMFFDNGPDYYSSGLRRIVSSWSQKYGFINKKDKIVIWPQFNFAYQFKGNYAIVVKNPGYKKEGWHTSILKGKFGLINKAGKVVIPMKYDSISQSSNNFKVMLNGKSKTIKL